MWKRFILSRNPFPYRWIIYIIVRHCLGSVYIYTGHSCSLSWLPLPWGVSTCSLFLVCSCLCVRCMYNRALSIQAHGTWWSLVYMHGGILKENLIIILTFYMHMYICICMDMMANIRFQLLNNVTSYGIKFVILMFIYDILNLYSYLFT